MFFHLLKLTANLISIHRLTKDLNCKVTFLMIFVYLRSKFQGGILELLEFEIGYVFLKGGYNFRYTKDLLFISQGYSSSRISENKRLIIYLSRFSFRIFEILLQHRRLGHSLYSTLEVLFPHCLRMFPVAFFSMRCVNLLNTFMCHFQIL